MTTERHNPRTGAREEDVARCESSVGARFPPWLRERLAAGNGWEVNDRRGVTGAKWRFLPVLDRSTRKLQARTAEDIAWNTRKLRADSIPCSTAVVVAVDGYGGRLVLLPDPNTPGTLGVPLFRQNGVAEVVFKPIKQHSSLGSHHQRLTSGLPTNCPTSGTTQIPLRRVQSRSHRARSAHVVT